ncbi:MAG TPA: DnaB-like helicase N-terminal domain-containing protein, partial [Candidatus Sumerlaeota bacterium]|nr:DnaB-like helicase N-terminal domain-containing protein [Candidatus Sumerlaeota bacterium]
MDKITETRALPQDINAEMCLLGAILLDNSKLSHIIDKVKSEHFYSNANRIILDTMISLYDRNIPLDLTTLRSELERNNLLEKAGGVGYIASL